MQSVKPDNKIRAVHKLRRPLRGGGVRPKLTDDNNSHFGNKMVQNMHIKVFIGIILFINPCHMDIFLCKISICRVPIGG